MDINQLPQPQILLRTIVAANGQHDIKITISLVIKIVRRVIMELFGIVIACKQTL